MKADCILESVVDPLVRATSEVLGTLTEAVLDVGPSTKHQELRTWGDISGAIKLTDEPAAGIILLGFEKQTILKLAEAMLSQRINELTQEVEDVAAELTNIVCAHAKTKLNELGYRSTMQQPWVLLGRNVLLPSDSKSESIRTLLTLPSGKLALETRLPPECSDTIIKPTAKPSID